MQFSGPSLTAEAPPADGMEMGPRSAPAAPEDGAEDFDHFISSAPRSGGAESPDSSSPAAAGSAVASGRRSAKAADGSSDPTSPATTPDRPAVPGRAADSASRDPGRRRRSAGDSPAPAAVPAPVLSAAAVAAPLDSAAAPLSAFLVGALMPGSAELLSSSLAPAVRNAAAPDQGGAPMAAPLPANISTPAAAASSARDAGPSAPSAPCLSPVLPVPSAPSAQSSPSAPPAATAEATAVSVADSVPALRRPRGAGECGGDRLGRASAREGPRARPFAGDRSLPDGRARGAPTAAASANPAAAPTDTAAPAPALSGNRPGASVEKFAAPAPLGPEALKPIVGDLEKKLLTPDDEKAVGHTPVVGTVSAEPGPAMTTFNFLHAATFIQGFADRVSSVQAAQTPAGFSIPSAPAAAAAAPVTVPGAPEAVAAVMKLIQAQANQSQGGVSAVNLSFKFGDDDLSVRVAWRDGIVQTQFHTDSDELRAALAGEWQSMAAAPASRALPLAAPVFSSSSDSTSASGDESRQSAQSGFGRDWGQSDGGPASAPLVPSGPVAPRQPPSLVAAGRLHAFA